MPRAIAQLTRFLLGTYEARVAADLALPTARLCNQLGFRFFAVIAVGNADVYGGMGPVLLSNLEQAAADEMARHFDPFVGATKMLLADRRPMALVDPDGHMAIFGQRGAPFVTTVTTYGFAGRLLCHFASVEDLGAGFETGRLMVIGAQIANTLSSIAPTISLTERQKKCIRLLASGEKVPSIARHMNISEGGVKEHIVQAKKKLRATTQPMLVARAFRLGLL